MIITMPAAAFYIVLYYTISTNFAHIMCIVIS